VSGLLKAGSQPDGRRRLAEATGISLDQIHVLVNIADLLRVKGSAASTFALLQVVGVDTIKKLQLENPDNLFQNLQLVNRSKHFVRRLPTLEMVADWIEQAKEMPPSVEE